MADRIHGLVGLGRDDAQWVDWYIDRCRSGGMAWDQMEEMRTHLRTRLNEMRANERKLLAESHRRYESVRNQQAETIYALRRELEECNASAARGDE